MICWHRSTTTQNQIDDDACVEYAAGWHRTAAQEANTHARTAEKLQTSIIYQV
jgi:hypothetical protein